MKKLIYLPLLLLTLVFGVNKVHASGNVYVSNFYDTYSDYANIDTSIISDLTTYWSNNLSSIYPHYIITCASDSSSSCRYILLISRNTLSDLWWINNNDSNGGWNFTYTSNSFSVYYYDTVSDTFSSNDNPYSFISWPRRLWYSTNFTPTFGGDTSCPFSSCRETVQLPSWSDLSLDVSFPLTTLSKDDTIPTYMSLTNGGSTADFTEVDMSDYDYIILSLKDYNTEPFNTTIYSLGRLCFTPVYDYGMTQKQSMYAGYQTAGCTEYYNSSTPVMIFIIQADIDNHAVYYIKRYNDETNILNIPTSIFDITYITPSNASDPQVEIGGRSYPALPYSDLSDTANKSSDEGYISGRVCSLGDVNCQASASGMDISDLFTQPLKLLQSLWASITSVFTIITTFITILPPILQTFLYVSFMLGIVIGIIKILL